MKQTLASRLAGRHLSKAGLPTPEQERLVRKIDGVVEWRRMTRKEQDTVVELLNWYWSDDEANSSPLWPVLPEQRDVLHPVAADDLAEPLFLVAKIGGERWLVSECHAGGVVPRTPEGKARIKAVLDARTPTVYPQTQLFYRYEGFYQDKEA